MGDGEIAVTVAPFLSPLKKSRFVVCSGVSLTALSLALIASQSLVTEASAACGVNPAGNFTAPVLCTQAGNANLVLGGPSTVTITNAAGTQDAIRADVTGNIGSATATVSNTTVINNDTTYPSIGIYALISTFTSPTGNATLNLSGTNNVTTANGTTVEANNRGTGASTIIATGTLNVTSLVTGTNDNDGIEATTHNGGAVTITMPNATGTVSVRGGNGILFESIAAGGVLSGNIGSVSVAARNTSEGAANTLASAEELSRVAGELRTLIERMER